MIVERFTGHKVKLIQGKYENIKVMFVKFNIVFSKLVRKEKQLKDILQHVINTHGTTRTAEVLDDIKAMGYKYSTRAAYVRLRSARSHGVERRPAVRCHMSCHLL